MMQSLPAPRLRWPLLIGVTLLILSAAFWLIPRTQIPYQLWKRGLYPYDVQMVERGIRRDSAANAFFVGKTPDELRALLGDVHMPTDSFALLISKNLGPRRGEGITYLQWADRYVVFEMQNGRVKALHLVHG